MQQPASGASPEDIALDKQVLRAQIRPRRLINRSNRAEAGQADYARRYQEGIYSLIPRTGEKLTIAAYLPTAAEHHRRTAAAAPRRAPHPGASGAPRAATRLGAMGPACAAPPQRYGYCRTRRRR